MGFYNGKRATDPKWTAGDEEHDRALAECGVAVEAASRVRALATRWLVQNIVPMEAVSIVAGAAGAGKSFFACQLAADTARQLGGRVVLATSGYERPELLRWRLDQAEGDPRRVAIATLAPIDFNDQRKKPAADEIDERLAILYHTIDAAGDPNSGILPAEIKPDQGEHATDNNRQDPVRLLVIDDADGWFGKPGNMLSAAALARVIERLNELARGKHLAIVITVRAQLGVEGRITARQFSRLSHAAGVVWMVVKEGAREGRPEESGHSNSRRWLLRLKNNLAEDMAAPGLTFELAEGKIHWRQAPPPDLAEALLPNAQRSDRRRLRQAASQWLAEALAAGPMPSVEVVKQAVACGISRGTLQRALDDLGVQSRKTGLNGGWEMHWTPPSPAATSSTPPVDLGLRIVCADEGAPSCASWEKHEEFGDASCASSEKHGDFADASCASWEKHEAGGSEEAGKGQRMAARAAC